MKNLYLPKGKTLHYETLYCQNIVNDGTLIVDGTLHARSISGKGILKAGTVSVRHVAEMDIECATMNGETMAAERVCAAEIVLAGSATVSCYLEAEYVEVPKLTMAKHNIGTLKADDVITLPEKKRGIVGTLVAGFFRRLWLSVIHRIPVDAPYVQVAAPAPESTDTEQEQPKHMGLESSQCVNWMVDYICDHREPVKLLLTRAEGTSYEHFVHNMVEAEVEYTQRYMEVLRRLGRDIPVLDKSLCHIIASGMFSGLFEIVVHDMPREQAQRDVEQFRQFYTGGWLKLMGG